jgi:hypothetical protein
MNLIHPILKPGMVIIICNWKQSSRESSQINTVPGDLAGPGGAREWM